jgi:hypothetical protein
MLKTVGFPSTRTGDQTIVNGNLVIGTAGKGIDFSANTGAPGMTSEVLSWYEEGTFTPTIAGRTTAGVQTYAVQTGFYTRIGNRVNFNLRVVLSAKDPATAGLLIIDGLPFTSNATASNFSAVAVSNVGLITLTALYNQISSHVEANSAFMYLGEIGSGQSFSYLQATAFTDTTRIAVAGTYLV